MKVVATSSITPSWKIESKLYTFNIVEESQRVDVESVCFSVPTKISKGSTVTLEATIEPAWATDCAVTWKSSDSSVASVNSKGKVTAKKFGEVTITCTSADNSSIKYSQKITVVPGKVKNVSQKSSSTGSVDIKWSKVGDAQYYDIYVYSSKTDKYEKKATSKTNSYTLSLSAGKTYKVKVKAVAKVSSKAYSSEFSDVCRIVTGPKAPELTVKAGTKKAVLSWNKVSGATHYVIYKIEGTNKTKIATINAEDENYTYTHKNLKADTYTYKIRTIRQSDGIKGYGSYSKAVSVKVK